MLFLGPLLSEASIHANTSGVFKGFYKDRKTGLGRFGGSKQDALFRITGDITLPFPVFSNFTSEVRIYRGDSNRIIRTAPEVDLAYLDPPYNQHPYGSNNSKGFIGFKETETLLKTMGRVEVLETLYNSFKGRRNFNRRNLYVKEYLYLLEK
jgi:adenine-specific DNA-methyltransferase